MQKKELFDYEVFNLLETVKLEIYENPVYREHFKIDYKCYYPVKIEIRIVNDASFFTQEITADFWNDSDGMSLGIKSFDTLKNNSTYLYDSELKLIDIIKKYEFQFKMILKKYEK